MTDPLVSIILPTRDRASSLGRAIESALAQSYPRLEVIVIDDGSTDETSAVLAAYGDRIDVVHSKGEGPYVARNVGLGRARGELIAFLDSDDAWLPHRLESQVGLLERQEVGLVFGNALHVHPGRSSASSRRTCFDVTPPQRGRVVEHFVRGNFVPTITVLVRRACLDEVGLFATTQALSVDYLTWFRIARRHELDFVDEVVAEYTVHPSGISHDLGRALDARIALFTDELGQVHDPRIRGVLRRLVFTLGVSLALAAVRGRAGSITSAWRRSLRALRVARPLESIAWSVSLSLDLATSRTRLALRRTHP